MEPNHHADDGRVGSVETKDSAGLGQGPEGRDVAVETDYPKCSVTIRIRCWNRRGVAEFVVRVQCGCADEHRREWDVHRSVKMLRCKAKMQRDIVGADCSDAVQKAWRLRRFRSSGILMCGYAHQTRIKAVHPSCGVTDWRYQ